MLRLLPLALLALYPSAIGAQQVALDTADAPDMIEAVVDYMRIEAHPRNFGHAKEGRPFYVNSAALEAFQKVLPALSRIPEQGRSHLVQAREAVVNCSQGRRACRVVNDGILLNIKSIEPTERGFRMRIDPEYNTDGKLVLGYVTVLDLEKVEGKWKVYEGVVLVP